MKHFYTSNKDKYGEPKSTKSKPAPSSLSAAYMSDNQDESKSRSEYNSQHSLVPKFGSWGTDTLPVLSERSNFRVFTFSELLSATKNFSRFLMIGEGGFGAVYRGVIQSKEYPHKKMDIAVKKLTFEYNLQGPKEWETEVYALGVVEHPHLVKLVGACAEGTRRLLIYEYMPNRSVQDHLASRFQTTLPWTTRLKIAQDAARGLAYLHEGMDLQIIFRDFKSSNVLLDEQWNAKLSDFGLARLRPSEMLSHVSNAVVGTLGYAAPEYINTGRLTCKCDIWSFGVFLYELITGRLPIDRSRPKSEQKLLEWVRPHLTDKKKFRTILDPKLEGLHSIKSALKLSAVANKCLARNDRARPKMSEVVEMLNEVLEAAGMGTFQTPLKNLFLEDASETSKGEHLGRRFIDPVHGETEGYNLAADENPLISQDKLTGDERQKESEIAVEENSLSCPEKLRECEIMTCAPPRDSQDMRESEIQLAATDTGGSAANLTGKITNGNEMSLPIHATYFRAGSFQNQEAVRKIDIIDAGDEQSVKPAVPLAGSELGTSNVITTQSLNKNVQKIFRCLNNARASKVGVHGVGGIGKTTAIEHLIRCHKLRSMFDLVLLVVVSRNWKIRKMQNEILRQISNYKRYEADIQVAVGILHGSFEADSQIAEKLLHILKGKKFLLLLDDVWEEIDLKAVGIPHPNSKNGCKILVVSRNVDVFRNMNLHKMIELEGLSRKESWELFSKHVGRIIDTPEIQPFARAILEVCHGLPLLIIVTARALIEKNNVSAWEHASRKFSLVSISRLFLTEDIIQLLKFSFDQLEDYDVKRCFLNCALFPEDREVNIVELVKHFIQEGVISAAWVDAQERGHIIVDALIRASLLQVTGAGDSIKMHGLIRDLALGILFSAVEDNQFMLRAEGHQFLFRAYSMLSQSTNAESGSSSTSFQRSGRSRLFVSEAHQFLSQARSGLTEPPVEEKWKQAKMIFLMDNEFRTLPEQPSCPNLLALFLQRNGRLRQIPLSFFDLMPSLKVLNLSKTSIKSLPITIGKLKSLEFLILRDCECLAMLPPEVGCLEFLEVLDLRGTEIYYLPDVIGELSSLRYLEVFFYVPSHRSECDNLRWNLIPRSTISRLYNLENLSFVVHPRDNRWYEDVTFVVFEVSKLVKLSSLCFYFPGVEHVDVFLQESVPWKDQQLTKFRFVVGHDVESIITSWVPDYMEFNYEQHSRCLKYVNGENIPSGVCQILARSTAFYLDHHLGLDSLSNFGVHNINELKFCVVTECPRMETVFDVKEQITVVFPRLENLALQHLWALTCIWKGNILAGSFAELRFLSVCGCPKLEYVFTSSITRFLAKLETLLVEDCAIMKRIIIEDEIIESGYDMLPSLKKLRLHYLCGLVNVWRVIGPSLEFLSFYGCPQLKKIEADSNLRDSLIEVKAEKSWWNALDWEDSELRELLEARLTVDDDR